MVYGGRVHGIRSNDFDELLRTNRLGNEYAERAEMYGGTPYLPTETNVPAHNVTHGGIHYPIEFHVPETKTGAGAVGTHKFMGVIKLGSFCNLSLKRVVTMFNR